MLVRISENSEEIQNSSTDTMRDKPKGQELRIMKAIHRG